MNKSDVERAGDRALAHDLSEHQTQESYADIVAHRIDELAAIKLVSVLVDEKLFITLDDNYEVIDKAQVMRALRNLDKAIRRFNMLHNIVLDAALTHEMRNDAQVARMDIDAVFTALHNIQEKVKHAAHHEAKIEIYGSQP